MAVSNGSSNIPRRTIEETRIVDEAIAWFTRLRANSVAPSDRQEFERWCQQSPSHKQAFHKVSSAWEHPVFKAAAIEAAYSSDVPSVHCEPRRLRWWPSIAAAAAIVIVLILASLQWDLVTRVQADYYTAVGEQRTIQLPDRSTVTLNTQTAIAVAYEGSVRKVQLLKGRAFFKVSTDPQRPFIVEHQGLATRAVGTEFVVQTQTKGIQVTVVEGLVQVADSEKSWPAIDLAAGKQVHVERGRSETPHTVDPLMATAWLRGHLMVTSALLEDVLEEVRRYYPGTIITVNPDIKKIQVTGTYHLDEPAVLLATLSKTLPFRMVTVADRLAVLY